MTVIADIYDEFVVAIESEDERAKECFIEVYFNRQPKKDRDPKRLFSTDIGKCPRQVAYRMLGTTKDPVSPEKQRNDRAMFDVANYVETMLTASFLYRGTLVDYQTPIQYGVFGRDNWGGRIDLIVELDSRLTYVEAKTHRGNADNYEFPKVPHVFQLTSYVLHPPTETPEQSVLWYKSRDGSGEPRECWLPSELDGHIFDLMDELEWVRSTLDADRLPAQREKELHLRSRGKAVMLEPSWECRYCDYAQTCCPDLSKSTWAELKGERWDVKKAADLDSLGLWADLHAAETLIPVLA